MNVGQKVTSFFSKQVSKVKKVEYRSLFPFCQKACQSLIRWNIIWKKIDSQAKKINGKYLYIT